MRNYVAYTPLVWLTLLATATAQAPAREPAKSSAKRPVLARMTSALAQRVDPPEPLPEVPAELTLSVLENIALTENPSIARAASLVQAARGNWVQVGLAPNPTTGYEGQQIGSRGLAEQDGWYVGQEIVRGGKLRLNREVAAQEIARACQELSAQQQRVLTDVRVLFYQTLIAQRQEQLANDLATIAGQSLTSSENLFKQKEVGKLDVLQARLEVRNASIISTNARNRQIAAWRSLASVAGRPDWPAQPLAGDLNDIPQHDWHESLEKLLTTSPEIAIAMTNIERARWAAERARVEKTPNVSVQGLVNWRDNGIGGGSDGAISVGIPLPLYDRNQGGIIQAEHQAVAAERALTQLELQLQNRLAPVFERYANAQNQVQEYRDAILPTAQESLELSRQLYQAGETSFLNVLVAQRSYSQTNLAYLDALRDLRTASAEIEGLLLSNSLQAGVGSP